MSAKSWDSNSDFEILRAEISADFVSERCMRVVWAKTTHPGGHRHGGCDVLQNVLIVGLSVQQKFAHADDTRDIARGGERNGPHDARMDPNIHGAMEGG